MECSNGWDEESSWIRDPGVFGDSFIGDVMSDESKHEENYVDSFKNIPIIRQPMLKFMFGVDTVDSKNLVENMII